MTEETNEETTTPTATTPAPDAPETEVTDAPSDVPAAPTEEEAA